MIVKYDIIQYIQLFNFLFALVYNIILYREIILMSDNNKQSSKSGENKNELNLKELEAFVNEENKELIGIINEFNRKCEEEKLMNSKFLNNDKVKEVSEILVGNNIEQSMQIYTSIINPTYIFRQLLEYEFLNISFPPSTIQDINSVKEIFTNTIEKYCCIGDLFDDQKWYIFEDSDRKETSIQFCNSVLKTNYYRAKQHLSRLIVILSQMFPEYDISKEFLDPVSECTRQEVIIELVV